MEGERRTRQPSGRSSIYLGKDGYWHGRVTVGIRDDGKPDRRHVMGKSKATIATKVRKLEKLRDERTVPEAGARWTVETWLVHWLDKIVTGHVKATTLSAYNVAVHKHLIPGIGPHRLDRLEPEHLESLYRRMLTQPTKFGSETKPATVHQVHRTIRTALNEAVRRGHLPRNPASIARAPRVVPPEIEPFTVDEIRRLFLAAAQSRNGVRWVFALALGLRQGEALGLKWTDIDLTNGVLIARRSLLRPKYAHGCGGTCGQKHPGYCPQRIRTNPETDTTKSRAGNRQVGLPPQLVTLLQHHKRVQQQEHEHAGNLWHEGGWVFTTETGDPISPRTDWSHWKALLKQAGIRDGRLHDARHTAATVLLMLGVSQPTMMSIMGWSNPAMAQRYAHVVAPIRDAVALQVGGLLWPELEPPMEKGSELE
ncbi:tyrosine-type recombinase/integrase [Knoellia sinensis]|nr:site-specific integrase [Knoellia sinensis]